jgi:hypothetical protein
LGLVTEHREGELVLLADAECVGRLLRADGHESTAGTGQVAEALLPGAQGEVAVGAPLAAVEHQHDRVVSQQFG